MPEGHTDEYYIKRFEPVLRSVVMANYYRLAGASSLPYPIDEMIRLLEAETRIGRFKGELTQRFPGGIIKDFPKLNEQIGKFQIWVWDKILLSDPDAEDPIYHKMYVTGTTKLIKRYRPIKRFWYKNTMFIRAGAWRAYIFRGNLENLFGLPKYYLAPLAPHS